MIYLALFLFASYAIDDGRTAGELSLRGVRHERRGNQRSSSAVCHSRRRLPYAHFALERIQRCLLTVIATSFLLAMTGERMFSREIAAVT